MMLIAYVLLFVYSFGCIWLVLTWEAIPTETPSTIGKSLPFISVVIPVRNEGDNLLALLQDIDKQSIASNEFELIIVNDASTDATKDIAEDFIATTNCLASLIDLPHIENNHSPKKRAITAAIRMAKGEVIVTTDGDCRVGENWLAAIRGCYLSTKAVFISAPVTFLDDRDRGFLRRLLNALQIIEFGSLVGSAACSIKSGNPNMCSGANLAYKRSAFYSVDGYAGNEQIASGDDEFLMHKMAKRFPKDIHFLKDIDAIVQTRSHQKWSSFYHQRKRWASKWRFYKNWQPTALAVYVVLANAAFVWALFTGKWEMVAIKLAVEWLFLMQIMTFFTKKWTIPYILLTQLIYPLYVVFFAVVAQGKGGYVWKKRNLK